MALHFAEQILVAVETTLTGLTTTGANVYRDYVYDLTESTIPGLVIKQGLDEPVEDDNQTIQKQDHYFEFHVEIVTAIASTTSAPTTIANLIRKEVHIALMADTTLGTAFAYGLEYVRTDEPETEAGEIPAIRLRITWAINYRSSYTDPSTA